MSAWPILILSSVSEIYRFPKSRDTDFSSLLVLSSDDAYLLALEFDRNPIIDDEAAFDLYPL